MKKSLIIFSLVALVIACTSNDKKTETKPADATTEMPADEQPMDPEAEKGLQLIADTRLCFTCHKVSEQSTGPAYEAVAARYPDTEASIDSLAKKVIRGGKGNWGEVPMPPNAVPEADARLMVKYILSLK